MSDKKEVTIGITINLDNFENLRLEVEGKVDSQQDADNLIAFIDGMLAKLGRGDEATAERVDAYRRRVFEKGIEGIRQAKETTPAKEPAPEEAPAEAVAVDEASAVPEEPQQIETTPEKTCPTAEFIEAAIPPAPQERQPEPAPSGDAAVAKSTPAEGTAACETCGAAVTKQQAKISQLFMGRTLCKKCMEHP